MKMNKEAIVAVAGFGFTFTMSTLLGYGAIAGDCTDANRVIALVAMAWSTAIMHSWLGIICRILDKRRPNWERIADLEARVAELEGRKDE